MIKAFSDVFIHIGSPYLLGVIFITGLWFKNFRGLFITAALCAGFSLWFNPILKEFLQIPLKFGTHTYAFPSGHSHTFASFFSVLLFGLPRNCKIGIGVILMCYAGSVYIRGYHEWFEIIGGYYFGIVQGLVFYFIGKNLAVYKP